MNIALEDTKEVVNGRVRKNYGDAFIRGNNGEWLDHSILKTADAYDVLQSCTSQQTHEAISVITMRASNIVRARDHQPSSSAPVAMQRGQRRVYHCRTMPMPEKSKHSRMV